MAGDRQVREEMARKSPEGMPPTEAARHKSTALVATLAIIGLIAVAVTVWIWGGWVAAGVAVVLVGVYFLIGAFPQYRADISRHEEEAEVIKEIDDPGGKPSS